MIDPQVAWDKLSGFETAEELRKYFQELGIQGRRGAFSGCPIANWISQQTGEPSVVDIGKITIAHWTDDQYYRASVFNHTDATYQFILDFDAGDYPELAQGEGEW